jgi:hypothetical protein
MKEEKATGWRGWGRKLLAKALKGAPKIRESNDETMLLLFVWGRT